MSRGAKLETIDMKTIEGVCINGTRIPITPAADSVIRKVRKISDAGRFSEGNRMSSFS
jgi:hypothetical protein